MVPTGSTTSPPLSGRRSSACWISAQVTPARNVTTAGSGADVALARNVAAAGSGAGVALVRNVTAAGSGSGSGAVVAPAPNVATTGFEAVILGTITPPVEKTNKHAHKMIFAACTVLI